MFSNIEIDTCTGVGADLLNRLYKLDLDMGDYMVMAREILFLDEMAKPAHYSGSHTAKLKHSYDEIMDWE